MAFAVGEVARLAGVSVRTLHHYEEMGLLTPSARTEAGYRVYSPEDLERLQQILCGAQKATPRKTGAGFRPGDAQGLGHTPQC